MTKCKLLRKLFIVSFGLIISSTINMKGQVTIGSGLPPAKAALLDIKDQAAITAGGVTATRGGAILPRVELVDVNELFPFFPAIEAGEVDYENNQKPAHKGMVVYHIGNANIAAGAYIWSGTEWEIFGTKAVITPQITGLQCNNAYITPSVLIAGEPYVGGVLKIPYTGGNGGSYSSDTVIHSTQNTGLIATLQPGTLEYGNGELVYTLTGTPLNSLPAKFQVNFLDQSCEASVSGLVLGIGQTLTFYGVTPAEAGNDVTVSSLYPGKTPTLDGLRMDIAWSGSTGLARIYNDSSEPLSIIISGGSTSSATINPGNYVNVVSSLNWGGAPAVSIINIQVRVSDTIFRWYEFKYLGTQNIISGVSKKVIFMAAVRIA